jgi:hypothetical protein
MPVLSENWGEEEQIETPMEIEGIPNKGIKKFHLL